MSGEEFPMSSNCAIKIDRMEAKLSLKTAIRNPVTSLSYMIFFFFLQRLRASERREKSFVKTDKVFQNKTAR